MSSMRPDGDDAWNYLRPLPSAKPYIYMKPIDQDLHELVILDGLKSKIMSNSDDPPHSFYTGDIFVPHLDISDAWKSIGRLNDRVTLATGEKLLPLQIEHRIREESVVKEAVVFGNGRFIPGLLVFRNYNATTLSNEDYISHIWPAVQDANSSAESFAQISKEAIIPVPANISYPRTDKGTIIRNQIYSKFAEHIEGMYADFENRQDGHLKMNVQSLTDWIIKTAGHHFGIYLEDADADFFAAGFDSARIFTFSGLMRKSLYLGKDSSMLRTNSVFEFQTPNRLAQHLYALQTDSGAVDGKKDIQEMSKLIERYSIFQKHIPAMRAADTGHVVVGETSNIPICADIFARCSQVQLVS